MQYTHIYTYIHTYILSRLHTYTYMVITKVYSTNIVTDNLYIQSNHTKLPLHYRKKKEKKILLKDRSNGIIRQSFKSIKIKQISWNKRWEVAWNAYNSYEQQLTAQERHLEQIVFHKKLGINTYIAYIALKRLPCSYCLHSVSYHIASKSFETFHTPPNHQVLMKILTLGQCSFTPEIFLQLICGCKINHFLLCTWIYKSFKYLTKSLETLHKWPIQYSFFKKLSLD